MTENDGARVAILQRDTSSRELAEFCRQVMPHRNMRGLPLGTHQNLKILLDTVGVSVRYNVMKKETEIIIPDSIFTTDNYYNASATWVLSLMRQVEMTTSNYMDLLEFLGDAAPYNPVETWIKSKPWDGESRLHDIYSTIEPAYIEDKPFIEAAISKWMLGAVESMCNPNGADLPGILVLQGLQKIGKTWWVRKLIPADNETIRGAVKVGMSIDPNNKDSVEQSVAHWVVEFGELDGIFRRADIAALKNFLTRPHDTFRKSFARRKSEYPRRTSFIANVNESHYLIDDTGNRRFWTIACKSVNSYHNIDMQQLWAEVYYKRMDGNLPYTLNDAEEKMLTEINERHMVVEPIKQMLGYKYNWESDKKYWRYLSATQIAQEMGIIRPDMKDVRKVASGVRKLNDNAPTKISRGLELLHIPPLLANSFNESF
jgi:putative DNA primase/helicase